MSLVLYETEGSTGIVTINRPEVMNALNSQVLEELDKVLDSVDKDTIRCLIIVFQKIGKFFCPVIAAINGYALGGGNELALSCDIRICSDNAMFGQPEVGLGITPGFGGTQRLARYVGQGMAKQMIYTGRPIDAETAKRLNLVNAVYSKEELMPAAKKMAKQIASNAPIAVSESKQAINASRTLPMNQGKIVEEKAFGKCFDTHDQHEGMTAFLEKRKEKNFTNN